MLWEVPGHPTLPPKLPASSFSGEPRPLRAVWEPEQWRPPQEETHALPSPQPTGTWAGGVAPADLSSRHSTHHFAHTGLGTGAMVHGGVSPISFLFLVTPGQELSGCQIPDCTQPPGPGRWPCGRRRWCGPLTSLPGYRHRTCPCDPRHIAYSESLGRK